MMPLMILSHLQNAGHCYSAFSHGLLRFRKAVRSKQCIAAAPASGERKHANSNSARLAQCRAARILKQEPGTCFDAVADG
jgi:hypothetical protein